MIRTIRTAGRTAVLGAVALIAGLAGTGLPARAGPGPVNPLPPPGWTEQAWNKHPTLPAPTHMVVSGVPGWQITLIAAGAVALAALAVLLLRARAARRQATATAT